jgi:hypothetical protein
MTTQSNKPSHLVYAVTKFARDKSSWDRIGAVWPHKDGKGFNMKLDLLPLSGGEIVIREPLPDDQAQHTETAIDGGF